MRPAWILMTILAIYVAGTALGGLVAPASRSEFMADVFARAPVATWLHLAGGSVALLTGAFQVSRSFRNRHRSLHRRLGALYLLGVVVAGTAAFPLAASSVGDPVADAGFGVLAACWVATTLLGFRAMLRGDFVAHEGWMYRSYALALGAVTLRIYMPLSQVAGIPFEEAYRVVAWLCWVPNLLIAERWFVHPVPDSARLRAN